MSNIKKTIAPKKQTIMEEAQGLIYGDRAKAYGTATENFTNIADMLTVILRKKLKEGVKIEPSDIPLCMIATKMCRELNSPKRDNYVDIVGYAGTAEKLQNGE